VRRIVDAACGSVRSTIEDSEQRYIAAGIAEWVITEEIVPSPEDITRKAIALMIEEVALSETGDAVRHSDNPDAGELSEQEIADIAQVLADQAQLSVAGVTPEEFSQAVENGVETLRRIRGRRS
jgi:hypothetical protein